MTNSTNMATASLASLNSQKIGSKFTLEKVEESAETKEPDKPSAGQLWGKCRFLVLALSVLVFTAARSNDMTFTFSVICMTNNASKFETIPFTPKDLSLSFAGAGAGAIMASLPFALLLHHFGGRLVMSISLMLSACATALLPYAASIARDQELPISSFIFPLRIIQGFGVASVMPMMGFVSAHWAPIDEIGNFMTMLSSSAQLSQIFTMPMSAHLCVTTGWPMAYYFHGIAAVLAATAFAVVFTNSPKKNKFISNVEIDKITSGVEHRKRKDQSIPYRSIITSRPVWAIWLAFTGNSFGFQLILQFMPTYLNKVLGVPIERTGFSAILPPLAQLIIKLLAGVASDKITCMRERRKLQLFNTIAMCGCGLFLLPLGYLHRDQSTVALFCFSASISSLGLVTCGSMKSATLVARQYSHFVMSIVQFVVCFGMLLVPFIVSTLAPDNTIDQWKHVFHLVAAILFLSNLGFCLICDSEAAEWTRYDLKVPQKQLPLLSDDPQATVATLTDNI